MIRTLQLINFQGYKNSTLEFDPFFNCIVGVGNAGKSSIIRALNLLLYNQWDKSWVTFGAKYCTIIATLTSGTTFTRKKGDKVNEYAVTYPDSTTQKFENFGTSIPDEIQKAWNIFAVELPGGDKIKLNLHSQFDASFLQSITSSNKAKLFGKLSGLDILDAVNQDLTSDKKQAQTLAKTKEEELIQVEQKLLSFQGLKDRRTEVDDIGSRLSLVQQQVTRVEDLQKLKERVSSWEKRHKGLTQKIGKYGYIEQVDLSELDLKLQTLKQNSALRSRVNLWKVKQKDVTQRSNNYLPVEGVGLDTVEGKVQNLKQVYQLQDKIASWKNRQAQLKQKVQTVETQLSEASAQYSAELSKSHVCPLCRSAISVECLASIIGEI